MAYFYVGGERDQLFLLPMSMRDWLDEGHLAWFVIDVVARVDTAAFHARHRNDGPGRPAYDPDMMLAVMFYAYATGLRSSRQIEARCRTDAAFRVICGNATPDHSTLARFLVNHETAIESVFVEVLRLCAAAGLVSLGTVAIDGTKMGSDAALDTNRSATWIRGEVQRIVGEAIATDEAEDSEPGLFCDEQLPVELSSRSGRLARLEAALAQIEAQDTAQSEAAEQRAEKARVAAAQGHKLRGRKPKEPRAALARAEAEQTAARVKAQRNNPDGDIDAEPTVVAAVAAVAAAKAAVDDAQPQTPTQANITDPESRILKTANGWVQGYNAQAAVNQAQIIIGHAVTQDVNDVGQYQPMVTATLDTLAAAGITDNIDNIDMMLADAGYWSEANATTDGPDRLIATLKDYKQRRAAKELGTTTGPPPDDATPIDAMEHRLRTPEGAATYAKRSHTVEPVFGDIKDNRGYRRFRRRGLTAARSEWALMAISHNLTKLFTQNHIAVT